jgi:hypothetical protein
MIFLPEQKLKSIIDFILKNLTEDYLSRLFGSLKIGDYSYFENAKEIFLKGADSPRKVICNLFFNRDRQGLPTIHISMNQEMLGQGNGLGFDPGSLDLGVDPQLGVGTFVDTTSRSYSSRFNIIFTSDNTFEVLIMYNTLKAFLQGNYQLLELNGLRNVSFSGQDIVFTDHLMPTTIYSRGFAVDCLYEFEAPSFEIKEQGPEEVKIITNCGNYGRE